MLEAFVAAELLAVERELDDLIVARVGDPEPIVVRDHLCRVRERPGLHLAPAAAAAASGRAFPRCVRARATPGRPPEHVEIGLTGPGGDELPVRADDRERRPGVHAPLVPDLASRVDDDRVRDAVAHHRLPHHRRVLLVRELRRVDSDDDESFVLQLAFQRRQHGQRVQAVDSGVGPEVEQHDAPQ